MDGYIETVSEIVQGLTEGAELGMNLKYIGLPVAQETFNSGHLEKLIRAVAGSLKSIRLVGVFKPVKRNSDGKTVIHPIVNTKALSDIALAEGIEQIELIEIPTIENSFISNFTKCTRLKRLSISWGRGLERSQS